MESICLTYMLRKHSFIIGLSLVTTLRGEARDAWR
jgi:hypothetical protein